MDPEMMEDALRRLASIEGHIRGVERMLEDDRPCVDIVRQTLAIKRALEKVGQLLVSSHLQRCIATDLGSLDTAERRRAIGDIMSALELSDHL
jgi:CsoR family transcriptional regulator, copper-sensing transcriptional repressor